MALVNPGLASRLQALVATIQQREAQADDNTVEGGEAKLTACRLLLLLIAYLERPAESTNALDYDDEQRTSVENFYKRHVVRFLALLLRLLQSPPVRTWEEVGELAEVLGDLTTTEDTGWRPEIIELGTRRGITVERKKTVSGTVSFETPGGSATAHVYKARSPDVTLDGAYVYLVEELPAQGDDEPTGRYVLMVDDPYWGRRIQPATFQEGPITESFTMGYRLTGRILEESEPVANANVSLELALETAEDGRVICWDSLEYNELVYDSGLATYVAGAIVLAPIRTDAEGRWEFLAPKGHGALYQRVGDLRDDTEETAAQGLARYVHEVRAAHKGRTAVATEGQEAVIDLLSGALQISAAPGANLLVGTLDNPGQPYTVPPGGVVNVSGLPEEEHSIVAFKLTPWGAWDQTWGCPRVIAQVSRGETTSVAMAPMEHYTEPNFLCGRVYERFGVPAAGLDIVAIDLETCEVVGVIATTNGEGYWWVNVPPEGLGGQLFVHDPAWGSMPVLGTPYSDVVLGARAYAAHYDMYKPEAWRRPGRGHANFQFGLGSVVVRASEGGELFATRETAYGGWVTVDTLPNYQYVEDIEELLEGGAQPWHYDLLINGECVVASFELRAQPFEGQDTQPGFCRAAGYYPEAKFFFGGKVHGNVLVGDEQRVKANLPEAARVGLEFGEHQPYVEVRATGSAETPGARAGVADLVCPYCGGPAHRDPSAAYLRGFCVQCANAFGRADAMDCRAYFETTTLPATSEAGHHLRLVQLSEHEGGWSRLVGYHWRPDLYDETDFFVTQSGPGQPTNAPRWLAKHVDEVGDGLGFGKFDGDQPEPFIEGHTLEYFEALPEIDRELGVTALKLSFPPGHQAPMAYTVDLDCLRADDSIETRRITIPAGTRGPGGGDDFGDVVRVSDIDKLRAEEKAWPYPDTGLYVGVAEVRLVEPEQAPGCKFSIVNDVPFLASPEGVPVEAKHATPVALQVVGAWGSPHILDDAVGQLFLFYADRGDICMCRRAGLPGQWTAARRITENGDSDEPWATKDDCGRLLLVVNRSGSRVQIVRSVDDGSRWEEVG